MTYGALNERYTSLVLLLVHEKMTAQKAYRTWMSCNNVLKFSHLLYFYEMR